MNKPDRKMRPAILPVQPGVMPSAERINLSNNVPVYLLNAGDEEVVRVDFIFGAGQAFESSPMISSTTNMMLTEGTSSFTAEALNKKIDHYGAALNMFAEKDSAGLSVAFLTKHASGIIDLCNEILFDPVFPEDELDVLLKKRLQWFEVSREKVQNLAYEKFFETLFGSNHPYGRIVCKEDFNSIHRDHLRSFHTSFYGTSDLKIIIAGKIPGEIPMMLERSVGQIRADNRPSFTQPEIPEQTGKRNIFIKKKGAVQSALRIGSLTISKNHPSYHGLKIADTILGGYFGSRLMKNIREEKGYTYGISSAVVTLKLGAYKVISSEVGAGHSANASREVRNEIKRLQEQPVSMAELDVVRNYMLGEMVRMFDGPFATSDSLRALLDTGHDYTYYSDFAEKIRSIRPDEISQLVRTYYNTDDQVEIVAGPK